MSEKYKRIGWVVQTRTSKGDPWHTWLSTQSPSKECAISRFDYGTRRGGFKSEGKDARLKPVYVEVQDAKED